MKQLRLDGKVAIITGAGRGLGRAYAKMLAERGASIVVNDLGTELDGSGQDASLAEAVASEIREVGGAAVAHTGSVTSEADMQAAFELAMDRFGGIDIVVNNAGNFLLPRLFLETTRDGFQSHFDIHLMGAVNLTRAVWPEMLRKQSGKVVNVGSHTAYFGHDGRFEYAAVKGAMHGFTMSLAMEAARNGITANILAPGAGTRPVLSWEKTGIFEQPAFAPELAAPTLVWLAHDSCTVNGAVIGAMAGSTSRIMITETRGYQSRTPSPEAISQHQEAILDLGEIEAPNILFPASAVSRGAELVEQFNALPQ